MQANTFVIGINQHLFTFSSMLAAEHHISVDQAYSFPLETLLWQHITMQICICVKKLSPELISKCCENAQLAHTTSNLYA